MLKRTFSRKGDEAHWTSILDFAERWSFPKAKAAAIQALEGLTIPTIERVVLYQKYHVTEEDIIHPHYTSLCKRSQPLSLPETRSLGAETTHAIFSIREALLRSHGQVDKLDEKIVRKAIDDYFKKGGVSDDKKSATQPNGSSELIRRKNILCTHLIAGASKEKNNKKS